MRDGNVVDDLILEKLFKRGKKLKRRKIYKKFEFGGNLCGVANSEKRVKYKLRNESFFRLLIINSCV